MNNRKILTETIDTYFSNLHVFISEPTFQETNQEIVITMFYFAKKDLNKPYILALTKLLTRITEKDVSFNLVKLHYAYMNSTIFAKYLCHNASANTFLNFRTSILRNTKFTDNPLPSFITGIRIQLSGRIITQKVIPRVTKNIAVVGSLAGADHLEYGYCTTKNYIGTFTIKVWIAIVC